MTDIVERLRGKPAPGDHCSKLIAEAADEIERQAAALDDERKAHQVCVEMRDKAYADIDRIIALRGPITSVPQDRPRDDGTVVAVGGEPGASKSE